MTVLDNRPVAVVWPTADPEPTRRIAPREAQILAFVAAGCTNAEIGRRLRLSPDTVKTLLSRACRKLGAGNRAHAVALSIRDGLIDLGAATNAT